MTDKLQAPPEPVDPAVAEERRKAKLMSDFKAAELQDDERT